MRKSALIIALVASAACKGSEIVDPAVTTTVVVTSTPTQIAVGETAQASAVVRDQNGNPLSGKSISWISLNPTIASVTGAGVIRGVAPGTATIQGSVDGITGGAAVQVVAPANARHFQAAFIDFIDAVRAAPAAGCAAAAEEHAQQG